LKGLRLRRGDRRGGGEFSKKKSSKKGRGQDQGKREEQRKKWAGIGTMGFMGMVGKNSGRGGDGLEREKGADLSENST